MEEIKYPALGLVRTIYRFIGWFILFVTLIVIVTGFIHVLVTAEFIGGGLFGFLGGILGTIWGSFVVLFIYGGAGVFMALTPFAIAEGLGVFIAIERNTRS